MSVTKKNNNKKLLHSTFYICRHSQFWTLVVQFAPFQKFVEAPLERGMAKQAFINLLMFFLLSLTEAQLTINFSILDINFKPMFPKPTYKGFLPLNFLENVDFITMSLGVSLNSACLSIFSLRWGYQHPFFETTWFQQLCECWISILQQNLAHLSTCEFVKGNESQTNITRQLLAKCHYEELNQVMKLAVTAMNLLLLTAIHNKVMITNINKCIDKTTNMGHMEAIHCIPVCYDYPQNVFKQWLKTNQQIYLLH